MHQWIAALRSAVRRPLFTSTTVIVLGFGIAANAALFSLVDAVLLRPLPYPHGDRLVTAMEASPRTRSVSLVSPAHLEDWNQLTTVFDAVSGMYSESATDLSGPEPERFSGRRVSARYFDVFEKAPIVGRTFTPEEERFGGPPAAVISEGLWTRRYNRDPGVIGQRLLLGGAGHTIIGVMPKTFAPPAIDVWLPATFNAFMLRQRDARFLSGVARLKAGVTLDQARAEVRRLAERLGEEFPRTDKDWSVLLNDYRQSQSGTDSRQLPLLYGAMAALLLILCANISGLLLGQLHQREREMAIRSSLGATRGQVAAMIVREGAVIAFSGAALSVPLAWYGLDVLAKMFATLPRIQELSFNWRFGLFAVVAAVASGAVFAGFPAWQATRGDLNRVLASGGRTCAGGRHRAHRTLVAAQFGITLALVAGAGLLLRSYYNLTRVDPGFHAGTVLTFHVGAEWSEDRARIGTVQRELVEEFQRLPGVAAAGFANFLPASNATLRYHVRLEGRAESGDEGRITIGVRSVGGGYLRALGVPLLAGEGCPEPVELLDFSAVSPTFVGKALVNRTFAERVGGGSLVGRLLTFQDGGMQRARIIGVLGDVREDALNAVPVPYVYNCLAGGGWPDPEYVVATAGDPSRLVTPIRAVIKRVAPRRAVFGMTTIEEYLARSIDRPRVNAALLGVFALAALVSAALGLYGLVMLTVVSRTRELGVRLALGAQPRQIVVAVVGESLRPLVLATVIGGGIAAVVLRSVGSMLFGVSASDLVTFAAAWALLLTVAAIAAWLPSRQAGRVDPVEALRGE